MGRSTHFETLGARSIDTIFDGAGRSVHEDVEQINGVVAERRRHFDPYGRVDEFDTGHATIGYTYTSDGLTETKTLPGGRVMSYTYDAKRRLASEQLSGQDARLYEYDALDRVVVIRVAPVVNGPSIVMERYAYDSAGRLSSWWHDQDRVRTLYTYNGNVLQDTIRFLEDGPSGQNTPQENDEVYACVNDITGQTPVTGPATQQELACSEAIRESIVSGFGAPIPDVGDVENATGVDAQVARFMHGDEYMHLDGFTMKRVNNYYVEDYRDGYHLNYVPTGVLDRTRQQGSASGGNIGTNIYYNGADNHATMTDFVDAITNAFEQIAYDGHHRITSRYDGTRAEIFTYSNDGLLMRVDYSDNSPSKRFDWDDKDRLLSVDIAGTDNGDLDLAYDDHGLVAIHENGAVPRSVFPIISYRGDITAYTDDTGATISTLTYSPYGERRATGNTTWGTETLFGYQGSYASLTLSPDQIWMRARTYRPSLGMFQQIDPEPAQELTGDTAYSYAANDPVNNVDPDGRTCRTTLSPGWSTGGMWFEAGFKCTNGWLRSVNVLVNPLSCITIRRVRTKLPTYKSILNAPATGCTVHEAFASPSQTFNPDCSGSGRFKCSGTRSIRINGAYNSWATLLASHCYSGSPGTTMSQIFVRSTLQWRTYNPRTKKWSGTYKKPVVPNKVSYHYACPLKFDDE